MQEQNSEKVVSLSVSATKVTANVLKSAVRAYLSAQKNKSPKVYKGKQNLPVFYYLQSHFIHSIVILIPNQYIDNVYILIAA